MKNGCLFIALVAIIGCGGSNGAGNAPVNDAAAGQQCLPTATCLACVAQSCNSQATTVFGSGYAAGNYNGGECRKLMACACTVSGNGNMDACAQQGGASCVTAFAALNSCMDTASCGATCNKSGNSGSGLSVNGNSMDFGSVELWTQSGRCATVTGANASSTLANAPPQIAGDVGCGATGCSFSAPQTTCETANSCQVCVIFTPTLPGRVTATLNIASGLTVALSGTGKPSSVTSTGGTTAVTGFGGNTGYGGNIGVGGNVKVDAGIGTGGSGGTIDAAAGGTTIVSGSGGSAGIDGGVDIGGAAGNNGNGGSLDAGGSTVPGTGGITGSGGAVATGGTTSSTTSPACPLGIWTTHFGYAACGTENLTARTTITQTTDGEYVIVSTVGPLHDNNASTGCGTQSLLGTSVKYNSGSGTLVCNSTLDTYTCPQKLSTMTMVFNADCTQASVRNATVNCLSCDSAGDCSGCGTKTCPGSAATAIRSFL